MPCSDEQSCQTCKHHQECDASQDEEGHVRSCDTSCAHYDELNSCCWQSGKWGLCFTVYDGDECHLGYAENDGN